MAFYVRPEHFYYLSIAGLGGYGAINYGLKGITHLSRGFSGTKPFEERIDQFFEDFLQHGKCHPK